MQHNQKVPKVELSSKNEVAEASGIGPTEDILFANWTPLE